MLFAIARASAWVLGSFSVTELRVADSRILNIGGVSVLFLLVGPCGGPSEDASGLFYEIASEDMS
jgi:hypothetical protein